MIKIDKDECTGCAGCIDLCPTITLTLRDNKSWWKEPPCKSACRDACPLHMNVPGYIYYLKQGDFKKAYTILRETNPLPAICGRVCYHPCEDACNRSNIDQSLAIASLKRFITDQNSPEDIELPTIKRNGKKVAIVGSGPAGITAAYDLALLGYEVIIFEAQPEPGGMLRYGIPEYRLPKVILKKEIGYLEKLGITIKTSTKIDSDISIDNLKESFDAVLIAVGAALDLKLGIPGEESSGMFYALDFLKAVNSGKEVKIGKKVAIIGGGNSAIDAARVSRRLNSEVIIIYRRSRKEMPASSLEIEAAEKEGIEFIFLATPVKILTANNRVSKLECIRTKLGPIDESGRPQPIPIEGSNFTVDIETIITAIGQIPDANFLKKIGMISSKGTLECNESGMVSKGIFAAGDVVTGPQSVVEAMASGRKAALNIDSFLSGKVKEVSEERPPLRLTQDEIEILKKRFSYQERVIMPELTPQERIKTFEEVELGFSTEQAVKEAQRCITTCIFCEICWKVCPAQAITFNGKIQQAALWMD